MGEKLMSRQHHYAIMFDEATNRWSIDIDTEEKVFYEGSIYNTATRKWEYGYAGDGNFIGREQELTEAISEFLDKQNELLLKTEM
jgi:hypothetical protein